MEDMNEQIKRMEEANDKLEKDLAMQEESERKEMFAGEINTGIPLRPKTEQDIILEEANKYIKAFD